MSGSRAPGHGATAHGARGARTTCATLLTALLLSGCATASEAPDPFEGDEAGARSISLLARNENAEDVTLFIQLPGRVERVGSVAPDRTRMFRVPWETTHALRVRVEILGGPRYTTNTLSTVAPGDRIELWVLEEASQSFIRRR